MKYLPFALFALAALSASPALAQQATINGHPADFDQYPGFLETTVHLPNNGGVVLRCGYSVNGASIQPDAGYMETSVINSSNNSYARYQRIDNKIMLTTSAPGMAGYFLVQATEPNGMTAAKKCQMNLNTDTLQNCVAAQPFATPADATSQDQAAAQQCGALFGKATTQLNPTIFNAQKAEQFKNTLRQKVVLLESP